MSKSHQLPGPTLVDRQALLETMIEAYGPLHWAVDPTLTSPAVLDGIRRALGELRAECAVLAARVLELERVLAAEGISA